MSVRCTGRLHEKCLSILAGELVLNVFLGDEDTHILST
jgi:hypothetical protein